MDQGAEDIDTRWARETSGNYWRRTDRPTVAPQQCGDYPNGEFVKCANCDGYGVITVWSLGVKEPDECRSCGGSGRNWRYPSGKVASHYGGPFV